MAESCDECAMKDAEIRDLQLQVRVLQAEAKELHRALFDERMRTRCAATAIEALAEGIDRATPKVKHTYENHSELTIPGPNPMFPRRG